MSTSNENVPEELAASLFDEDEASNDEEDEWLAESDFYESEDDNQDISELPMYVIARDGALDRLDYPDPLAQTSEEYEVEWHDVDCKSEPNSSLSSQSTADFNEDSMEVEPPVVMRAPAQMGKPSLRKKSWRGSRARQGRGRGGFRSGRVRASRREGGEGWTSGQPLQERYISEEDLPVDVRESIKRTLDTRRRKSKPIDQDTKPGQDDDVFYDAEEECVWRGMEEWSGRKEEFVPPRRVGPTVRFTKPYDALSAIWDDGIMSHIVAKTNSFARTIASSRFQGEWYDTNIDEMWTLFAFWMMLGIIKMPSIRSCFSKMPLLKTDVFRSLMTETRYWNLNRAFRLAEGSDQENVLHPMGPVIDHLNSKFQELYQLDQEICIDESLTLWKGPAAMRQCIKTKAARWGIKSFQLCESATGYLWSFFVYCGKGTDNSGLPATVSTVLRLIRPILNLGHVLYMDNWFNSPMLARNLKRHKTDCVGTLRANRKGVPLEIERCPLAEGQLIARCTDNVMVVALQDRKRVTCISTYHDLEQVHKAARSKYRLRLVDDYNRGMGGVDLMDQMLEPYLVERKQCLKWSKKLFKRLLNASIQNARILLEKSTKTKQQALVFRLMLVQEIINRHLPNVPRKPYSAKNSRNSGFPMSRLTERHFIQRIPVTSEMEQSVKHACNRGRRYCVWCTFKSRGNRKTVYECPDCKVALCLDGCFKEFHTQP